jgi:hypothetical protein
LQGRSVVDGGLSNAAAARRFNTTAKTLTAQSLDGIGYGNGDLAWR